MGQLKDESVSCACLADGAVWSHVALLLVVVVGGGARPLDAGERLHLRAGGAGHQHAGFTMMWTSPCRRAPRAKSAGSFSLLAGAWRSAEALDCGALHLNCREEHSFSTRSLLELREKTSLLLTSSGSHHSISTNSP